MIAIKVDTSNEAHNFIRTEILTAIKVFEIHLKKTERSTLLFNQKEKETLIWKTHNHLNDMGQ